MLEQLKEIYPEFKRIFFGQSKVIDIVLPTFTFIVVNRIWDLKSAAYVSFSLIVLLSVFRLFRKEKISSIIWGLISVVAALVAATFLGKSEGYFLPGLIQNAVLSVLIFASIVFRLPAVAWTSYFSHRWPIEWYKHPLVKPAYMMTTYYWLVYFTVKTFLLYFFYQQGNTEILAIVGTLTSWPGFVVLLVLTYIQGSKKLEQLKGPSVEEFINETEPPFKSQIEGF